MLFLVMLGIEPRRRRKEGRKGTKKERGGGERERRTGRKSWRRGEGGGKERGEEA